MSRFRKSAMVLSGEELILEGPFLNAATNHNVRVSGLRRCCTRTRP